MALKLRKGGVWQSISGLKIFSGGSWRSVVNVKIYKGGVWVDVANFTAPAPDVPTMTVKASPADVYGSSSSQVAISNSSTATPTGGLAPYTYAWSVVGSGHANTPTKASTTFYALGMTQGQLVTGTATCTVTDSLGTTATTNVVTYSLNRF